MLYHVGSSAEGLVTVLALVDLHPRMGQYVSLQLVRPVELFIAARVASVTTNAGEQHESTED